MFRISFLFALLAVAGVAAQDSSAPSVAPVDGVATSAPSTPPWECRDYCCQLAENVRALDSGCDDWGTDACGECEIPLWCFFIPEPSRCATPVCCSGDNTGDNAFGSCPAWCCDVVPDTREKDPTCVDWGTDACGECEIPDWCDTIPKASRCDTPICCSGAGNLSMNTAFAIIAAFVALFLKDFFF
jgi:hypothetical protein